MLVRENREVNLIRAQMCVRDAMSFIERVENMETLTRENELQKSGVPNFATRLMLRTRASMCTRVRDALQESLQGLHNLLVTYQDDTSVCAKIQLLVNEVDDFLKVMNEIKSLREKEGQTILELEGGFSSSLRGWRAEIKITCE